MFKVRRHEKELQRGGYRWLSRQEAQSKERGADCRPHQPNKRMDLLEGGWVCESVQRIVVKQVPFAHDNDETDLEVEVHRCN